MDKLHLLYDLTNAQGIKTGFTGRVVTPPPTASAPTPIVETIESAPKVDHLPLL